MKCDSIFRIWVYKDKIMLPCSSIYFLQGGTQVEDACTFEGWCQVDDDYKDEIEVEDLPNELLNADDYVKLPETNAELSPENVQAALEKYNHNLNMVANIFGISRTTLWRYRQKHKL